MSIAMTVDVDCMLTAFMHIHTNDYDLMIHDFNDHATHPLMRVSASR